MGRMRKHWAATFACALAGSLVVSAAVGVALSGADEAGSRLNESPGTAATSPWRVEKVSNPAVDEFGVTLPEVRFLADGTMIQRTPSFPASAALANKIDGNYGGGVEMGQRGLLGWNDPESSMSYWKADERGCNACHADLAATVVDGVTGSYYHTLLNSGLPTEVTVNQCNHCHHVASETGEWIHVIHGVGGPDAKAGCYSCHALDTQTKEWTLWENVKYDALSASITRLAAEDVPARMTYTQDKLIETDELYNVGWNNAVAEELFNLDSLAGRTAELDDTVFDEWPIRVFGEGVEAETAWNLGDLVTQAEEAGVVMTVPMATMCIDNAPGMGLIGQVEVTGVPVQWLMEQAGLKDTARSVSFLTVDDAEDLVAPAHALNFDDSTVGMDYADREVLLVYEINGERLSVADGFPCAVWCGADKAGRNHKLVTNFRVDNEEVATFTNPMGKNGNYANMSAVGIESGVCVQAGEPFVVEGYAFGFARTVDNIEYSFDLGETWNTVDTTDTTGDKWVWWNLEFTPPEGVDTAYVLEVRCTTDDGLKTGQNLDGETVLPPLRYMINAKADLDAFRAEVESR